MGCGYFNGLSATKLNKKIYTDWSKEPLGIESEAGHDDHGLEHQRVGEVRGHQDDLEEVDGSDLLAFDLDDQHEAVGQDGDSDWK